MGEIMDALRRAKVGRFDSAPSEAVALPLRPEPILGAEEPSCETVAIPTVPEGNDVARAVLLEPSGEPAERYRHFSIKLRRALQERRTRSVVVTSAVGSEGKTTTACNLALALASTAGKRRVALVDLDLRRPGAARGLGVRPRVGMEAVLRGEARLQDARLATQLASLDLFLCHEPTREAHELLAGELLGQILEQIDARYETIVIDAPPVLFVPDVPLILAHGAACVVVAQLGVTRRKALLELLDLLPREQILGMFLNRSQRGTHKGYYGYYGQGGD
jgi:polysaccharide biosynthesis transport protein